MNEMKHIVDRHPIGFNYGFNSITEIDGKNKEMQMDFAIVKLKKGLEFVSCETLKERVLLLIQGSVELEWENKRVKIKRDSCFDENPICLHVPKEIQVKITGILESELVYQAVYNEKTFSSKLYKQNDCISEEFGKGVLNETSLRTCRTIIDDSIAPYSNLVIGEVLNYPGRWSSYPPHYHIQPEIYFYKFYPRQGFGYGELGEEVYKIHENDSAFLTSGKTHSQVTAPGYAMYYVWLIPHIKEKRWEKDRIYLKRNLWMLEPNAKIWPEK